MKAQIVSDDGALMLLGPLVLKRYPPTWVVVSVSIIGGVLGFADVAFVFREYRKHIRDEFAGAKVIPIKR
jgi:hypothetical protein